MTWAATVLTLYPEMFPGPLGHSLAGRALAEGIWSLDTVQIRDFATDKHRSVDDTPAGGGAGMVMRADVLAAAVDHVLERRPDAPMLAMTPARARRSTQALVRELAAGPGVSILCGRFEGIDERLFEARPVVPVSIGDYVLSGGEIGAFVLLDACIRLLPGVMGAASSGEEESFESGLLEYPHYTRPVEWEGRTIPEVLRSGDHAKIAAWRKAQGGGRYTAKAAGPDRAPRGRAKATALWRAATKTRTKTNEPHPAARGRGRSSSSTRPRPIPEFRPGDTLRVGVKVVEGERTRVQNYEGVCIARANRGMGSSFTVRKISFGEGVERVFPLYSPNVDSDRGRPPRRRPPRQALLSARPHRQVGPHRRAPRHAPSRQAGRRDRDAGDRDRRGLTLRQD